jgi:hypothetical protein
MEVTLEVFLTRQYMDVSGRFYCLVALPPGEDLPVPIRKEAGSGPEPVWKLWRK